MSTLDPMEQFSIQMFTRKSIADMLNQAIDLNKNISCKKFTEDDNRLTECFCKDILDHLYSILTEESLGDEWDDSMLALGEDVEYMLNELN